MNKIRIVRVYSRRKDRDFEKIKGWRGKRRVREEKEQRGMGGKGKGES